MKIFSHRNKTSDDYMYIKIEISVQTRMVNLLSMSCTKELAIARQLNIISNSMQHVEYLCLSVMVR